MFERFFIYLSGADYHVLKDLPPSEKNRFISLGMTILFTGIFAFIAGYYALYRVFFNEPNAHLYSLAIGLLWGCMILNLDRYIVSSMNTSDYKSSNRKTFFVALPRIVLAVLISLVIAKPLEVRIFEDRIRSQIFESELSERQESKEKIASITGVEEIESSINNIEEKVRMAQFDLSRNPQTIEFSEAENKMDSALEELRKVKSESNSKINSANKNISFIENSERYKYYSYDGEPTEENLKISLTKEGEELIAKYRSELNYHRDQIRSYQVKYNQAYNLVLDLKKKHRDQLAVMLNEYKEKNAALFNRELEARDAEKVLSSKANEAISMAYSNNFIAQVEALGELTKFKKDIVDVDGTVIEEAENTMFWMNLFIIALFVLIECAPVFVKLLMPIGIYEERLNLLREESLSYSLVKSEITRSYYHRKADLELKVEMLQSDKLSKLLELTSDEHILELKKMNSSVVEEVELSVKKNNYAEAINLLFEFVDKNSLDEYEKKVINIGAKLKYIEKNIEQDTIEHDFGMKEKASLTNDLIELASEIQEAK